MTKQMVSFLQNTGFKRMLLFSVSMVQVASAQVEIRGAVTDAETGESLPGVNVKYQPSIYISSVAKLSGKIA